MRGLLLALAAALALASPALAAPPQGLEIPGSIASADASAATVTTLGTGAVARTIAQIESDALQGATTGPTYRENDYCASPCADDTAAMVQAAADMNANGAGVMLLPARTLHYNAVTEVQSATALAAGMVTAAIANGAWTSATYAISSGTYTQATGAVSLTMASSPGLGVGATFCLSGVTASGGTGVQNISGCYTTTAGTSGTTVNFTATLGLGVFSLTGGSLKTGPTSLTVTASLPAGLSNDLVYDTTANCLVGYVQRTYSGTTLNLGNNQAGMVAQCSSTGASDALRIGGYINFTTINDCVLGAGPGATVVSFAGGGVLQWSSVSASYGGKGCFGRFTLTASDTPTGGAAINADYVQRLYGSDFVITGPFQDISALSVFQSFFDGCLLSGTNGNYQSSQISFHQQDDNVSPNNSEVYFGVCDARSGSQAAGYTHSVTVGNADGIRFVGSSTHLCFTWGACFYVQPDYQDSKIVGVGGPIYLDTTYGDLPLFEVEAASQGADTGRVGNFDLTYAINNGDGPDAVLINDPNLDSLIITGQINNNAGNGVDCKAGSNVFVQAVFKGNNNNNQGGIDSLDAGCTNYVNGANVFEQGSSSYATTFAEAFTGTGTGSIGTPTSAAGTPLLENTSSVIGGVQWPTAIPALFANFPAVATVGAGARYLATDVGPSVNGLAGKANASWTLNATSITLGGTAGQVPASLAAIPAGANVYDLSLPAYIGTFTSTSETGASPNFSDTLTISAAAAHSSGAADQLYIAQGCVPGTARQCAGSEFHSDGISWRPAQATVLCRWTQDASVTFSASYSAETILSECPIQANLLGLNGSLKFPLIDFQMAETGTTGVIGLRVTAGCGSPGGSRFQANTISSASDVSYQYAQLGMTERNSTSSQIYNIGANTLSTGAMTTSSVVTTGQVCFEVTATPSAASASISYKLSSGEVVLQ